MLKVVLTLDYEIHGNGEGSPLALMVEPTARLIEVADRHGAKLTIMADVAEIQRFQTYARETGRDDFCSAQIEDQLKKAVAGGHDVQLHLHPSYFRATFTQDRWIQDWSEYNFAGLPVNRMCEMVRMGKMYLENLLRPVCPTYQCIAFRAANWSVSPSPNVYKALFENGIHIDTSIFKDGKRTGIVSFDYTHAHSALTPWPASKDDFCRRDAGSRVFEFPIYSEARPIWSFLTWSRLARVLSARRHRVRDCEPVPMSGVPAVTRTRQPWLASVGAFLLAKHALKADLNQCSVSQLIRALHRAEALAQSSTAAVPFVLIGHSKLFGPANSCRMGAFLDYVRRRPSRLGFARFAEFDLTAFT